MTTPIIILGTGGHARVVLAIARACGYAPLACLEPIPTDATPATLDGVPVLRGLELLPPDTALALGVGDNAARARLLAQLDSLRPAPRLPALAHPAAFVDPAATLARGVVVAARAVVGVHAHVHDAALVNTGAIVDHECVLGPCAHVCPGARLAGRVRVGARALVGLGCVVIQTRTIGDDAVVGAGAVVLADVPPHATAVGVPARIVKRPQP